MVFYDRACTRVSPPQTNQNGGRWCAGSRCVFRTCFCRPVRAEAGKAGLVAKEESITKEDAKLEGDLGALEEKEQELEDVGDPGAAKVVAAEAKKVESAVVQNEKTKVAVEKAEVEMDEKAAEEDPRTACEEGFIEVPTPSQPVCKRVAFPPQAGDIAAAAQEAAHGLVAPAITE
jgi:hypothetical protein